MRKSKNNPRGTSTVSRQVTTTQAAARRQLQQVATRVPRSLVEQRELYRMRLVVERVEEQRLYPTAGWVESDCEQWGDNNFVLSSSADANQTKAFVDELVSRIDDARDLRDEDHRLAGVVFPLQIDAEDETAAYISDAGHAILCYMRMRQEESLPDASLAKLYSFFKTMPEPLILSELNRLMELDLVRGHAYTGVAASSYALTREGYRAAVRKERP